MAAILPRSVSARRWDWITCPAHLIACRSRGWRRPKPRSWRVRRRRRSNIGRAAMSVLINIDVPDLAQAIAFYTEAFGLTISRRFGADGVELGGWPAPVFLLKKDAGSIGAGESARTYIGRRCI